MPTDVYKYIIVMKSIKNSLDKNILIANFYLSLQLKVLLQRGGKEITQDQPWS